MPTTTKLGLSYPAANDAPDGPGAFYALALDLEDGVTDCSVYSSPAIVHAATIAPYNSGNYSRASRVFGVIHFNLGAFMNGNTITANAKILTLPDGFRPALEVSFSAYALNGSTYVSCYMTIDTGGAVYWQGGGNPGPGGSLVGAVSFAAA